MTPWLDAFVPAFGLLALGFVLRRVLLRDEAVWSGMERLVFWVLLPCLVAGAIAGVDLARLPVGGMALAIWGAVAVGTAASWAIARAFGAEHAAATSVLQGAIRFNTLLAFAVAGGVFGAPGVALGAVAVGLIVPTVQVITTLAFALGGGRRASPRAVVRQVVLNPLILGCVVGFALSALGGLPPGVGPLVRSLGQACVALGLLGVGAALAAPTGAAALADRAGLQAVTAGWKLLAMPALTALLATALGVEPLAVAVAALFMAQPTATTAYVQARIMGGDAPLMAALITSQHVAAVLTLPLWAWWLRG